VHIRGGRLTEPKKVVEMGKGKGGRGLLDLRRLTFSAGRQTRAETSDAQENMASKDLHSYIRKSDLVLENQEKKIKLNCEILIFFLLFLFLIIFINFINFLFC
jgi:hypothetical protein